jgi:hypothetical protein
MWWPRRKVPRESLSPTMFDAALRIKVREHVTVRQSLSRQHPELSDAELDQCVSIAEAAHRGLGELFDSLLKSDDGLPDSEVFHALAHAQIPWISQDNISGYFSQCVHSLLK